jgi:histidinol-phosphate aminotransferase
VPGKPIDEVQKEYGLEKIEKLASNENPLGPSPKALVAIQEELGKINIYPESSSMELRQAISEELGVAADQIVVGNGGEHIIQVIAQTFINSGDEVILADTTFELYSISIGMMGGNCIKVPLKNYKHDVEEFANRVTNKTKLIFLCNPNNPTGNIVTKDEVEYLLSRVPEDVVIVIDEAYYHYARLNPDYPDSISILKNRPNTVVIRTFSKIAGIAAVRVGIAVTSKEIAVEMNKARGVFYVNKLAQAGAMGALKDKEHIERTIKLNSESMKLMEEYFEKNNLEYVKSSSNFIFVNVKNNSRIIFQKLMEKGVIVRPGYPWNWDNWLRVSTGTIEQTKTFIEKLDEVLIAI